MEHSTKMADSNGNESLADGNESEALVLTKTRLMEEIQKYECLYDKQDKELKDKYRITSSKRPLSFNVPLDLTPL